VDGDRPHGAPAPADPFAHCPRDAAELAAAFRADVSAARGRRSPGAFLPLLEAVLARAVRDADDARLWDAALLRARRLALPPLPEDARGCGERLLGQARLMVADKSRRLLEYARWADEQEARRLRELGTALTTATDTDALTGALAERLPAMGVQGCRLLLYGDGDGTGTVRPVPTREERTAAAGTAAGEPVTAAGALRYAPAPPPEEDRRFTLVAEPLHLGEERLGFALFDAGSRQGAATRGALYRALGDQVSAALKGIRLLDEVQRARDAAERASRLKTRLLDNATDELRTPVEEMLHRTRPDAPAGADPAEVLRTVHADADRLLRIVDDLLDLSRSEIDALDLSRLLLSPRPLLVEAFTEVAGAGGGPVRLSLPRRLPAVCADPARLRQILVALLTAAAGPPGGGAGLALSARVRPPVLRVQVEGPGLSVPREDAERLLEPFASAAQGARLGPAVARRLAVLHGGSVSLCETSGRSAFRLELPLPTPADAPCPLPGVPDGPPRRTLYVASSAALDDSTGEPSGSGVPRGPGDRGGPGDRVPAPGPPEAAGLARRHGWRIHRPHPEEDLAAQAAARPPAAVAWDTADSHPHAWASVRALHDHPACRRTPFLLYGPVAGRDLDHALGALRPDALAHPAVVADGSAAQRRRLRRLLAGVLPGRAVRSAADGASAAALVAAEPPCLLVVARDLPDMSGFDVVDRMCEAGSAGQPPVPVLVLGARGFTRDDLRRAEPHPALTLLGRDVLTDAELTGLLTALTSGRADPGALRGHPPVRSAVAFIEQHYRQPLSRRQIARAAGVSEHHLGRLFHRRLGLTLWDYLIRVRVNHAKERLRGGDESVQAVARAVGFQDRAYFSRVFRKVTGVAPHVYREAS
jgi:signal transduction histidine kinase/AraC-like DNA-binding protein